MVGPDFDDDGDRAVARLLSGRPSISRPEHESIAAAVLEATAAEAATEPAGVRWWWPAGFAALLAVGLAVWLIPAREPGITEPEAFVARGDARGPQLQLRCEPSCVAGGQVLLEVTKSGEHRYVAVFSFREDGVVIWYAPDSADGRSAALPEDERGLLPFRIELDAEHVPGDYDVVAVFSPEPLDRAAIRRAYEARPDSVAIVERTLAVKP